MEKIYYENKDIKDIQKVFCGIFRADNFPTHVHHEIEVISEKEKLSDAAVIDDCGSCLYSVDYYAAFDDGAVYTGIFPVE